ncbi:MAG: HAMP domain-containing histidine kinase [Gemmatimonadetes bacterium]|nr:HAMP domain-containing histidine kinase [Gemmatimonadota bacterium]
MTSPLTRLRRRLTLWYVGIFALILLAFGAVTYEIVVHQVDRALDRSLMATVDATAALIEEADSGAEPTPVPVVTPGRRVWVLNQDLTETGYSSTPAEPWVLDAARRAFAHGTARAGGETPQDRIFRLRARAVTLPDGRRIAVLAAAVLVEIEDQYPSVILGFALAGLASLGLVALGGWRLARRSLDPVDRAMSEMRRFMADAAHELRTPLAVLRGHADVALQKDRDGTEYREVLDDVSREAARMGDIVERMLLLARAEAGDWPTARESLFLDDVVLDVGNAGRALGGSRGVRIEVGDLDEAPVRGDPALLRQLLMAFVDNAVKFSPDGGTVRLSLVRQGDMCVATVEDEGPGIPDEARPHVFERFYRADAARPRQQGAGLGLAIAEWIAELHGGSVALGTRDGGGTRAAVTLPLELGQS